MKWLSPKSLIDHKKRFFLESPVMKSLTLLDFYDGALGGCVKRVAFTLLTHPRS